MAKTNKQEAGYLSKQLDNIWKLGDHDECSIKHIYWSLSALLVNLSWKDGLDYETPWDDDDDTPEHIMQARIKHLGSLWDKVTAKRDGWGLERFLEIVRLTKFSFAEEYCDWYKDK